MTPKAFMPRFLAPHFDVFVGVPFAPQAPFGLSPRTWALRMLGVDDLALPHKQLSRAEVRDHCSAPNHVLHGYKVAMAWGMQGASRSGPRYPRMAWAARKLLEPLIEELRAGQLTRQQAYDLFTAPGKKTKIPGLGPAYFTKLIYFFSPLVDNQSDRFIMDQWTAKSINLLTGEHIVRVYGDGPADANTGLQYESFCAEVEMLARHASARLGQPLTGNDAEQMMFSLGGRVRRAWRAHVVANWKDCRPTHRFDVDEVLARASCVFRRT